MSDPVREYLERRGARPDLIAGGLRGLVRQWERIVDDVSRGYQLTLDDYLNDLDARDLLDGALAAAGPAERNAVDEHVERADRRFVDATEPGAFLGDPDAETAATAWWYRRHPRAMGTALRRDLDRWSSKLRRS